MDPLLGSFLIFVLTLFIFLRLRVHKAKSYFQKMGLPYLGNRSFYLVHDTFTGLTHEQRLQTWYKKILSSGNKIGGTIEFGMKCFLLADPELIKDITIRDFQHFYNRREFSIPEEEVLFCKMLFALKGEEWKGLRHIMTPAFTTGKIKRMYRLFAKSGEQLVPYLHSQSLANKFGEVDMSIAFRKFTVEIIATAVCGLQSHSFQTDVAQLSHFEAMSKRMEISFGGKQLLKLIVLLVFPRIGAFFNLSIFDREAQNYFLWAIKKIIKIRENDGKKYDDFIQFMIEARKEGESGVVKEYLSDEHIVANCTLFILAGYDTTYSAMIFCAYALATNQDIQDKLREEVKKAVQEDKEKEGEELISYDMLHKMPYLEMVFNETLRLYPPTSMFDRGCQEDYTFPGTNVTVRKGQGVLVPVDAIHQNPLFYPNPEKFDPSRFSDENKDKIPSGAYLPFGVGQRGCIGSRFAITEAKLGIAVLVHNFKIEPGPNTLIPMQFAKTNIKKPKGGAMNLKLTRISGN